MLALRHIGSAGMGRDGERWGEMGRYGSYYTDEASSSMSAKGATPSLCIVMHGEVSRTSVITTSRAQAHNITPSGTSILILLSVSLRKS